MFTSARVIQSPQPGPHRKLHDLVQKHATTPFRKPFAAHTLRAFHCAHAHWQERGRPPLILDSGCGTAESTRYLCQRYPNHLVIGLDQSQLRLNHSDNDQLSYNGLLLRCDCVDFWRLARRHHWQIHKHFLLYPNPWPKPQQLQRRWHGHPCFPDLLAISQRLELRTNWYIYAQEFAASCDQLHHASTTIAYNPREPISAFERKYQRSQHSLWRVVSVTDSVIASRP